MKWPAISVSSPKKMTAAMAIPSMIFVDSFMMATPAGGYKYVQVVHTRAAILQVGV